MRFQQLFQILFLLLLSLLLIHGDGPANLSSRRRKLRHKCPHRRCMALHSRVPFP
ncbi:apelin receptor early endogenous ligand [Latimeria chalumnae]|uniref:apelin receptor early endogenous ligand n=1 Tax=Latimeria chalumnae TaxID=7897 RepID=UPI0006D8E810|nr:PREDICTED: apelin receptor early endogenous ligand [Latimeria chalumnae]|eukprot:XP_014352760.1 PREDICTED: apelin receptor early endogenous ligand [Latimeria chalumnae]